MSTTEQLPFWANPWVMFVETLLLVVEMSQPQPVIIIEMWIEQEGDVT